MGVCYAIAHAATGECFELGKGPWWEWRGRIPTSLDEVKRAFVYAYIDQYKGDMVDADPARCDAEMCRQAEAVWSFLAARPGCFIVDDHGDDFWSREDRPEDRASDEILRRGGSRIWRSVGSIDDPRPDFVASQPSGEGGGQT